MILKFLRFESELTIEPGHAVTLEVENRRLFSRMVVALRSEGGEQAIEPYALWDAAGKKQAPRGALMVLNSLPEVPFDDRTLLGKLYGKLALAMNEDPVLSTELTQAATHLEGLLLDRSVEFWGNYRFDTAWNVAQMLKAFSFKPDADGEEPLLDQLVALFGLCCDVGLEKTIALVNAKSFLEPEELSELVSQAFFYGRALLLLESWPDENRYDWERKTRIDQWFLEN